MEVGLGLLFLNRLSISKPTLSTVGKRSAAKLCGPKARWFRGVYRTSFAAGHKQICNVYSAQIISLSSES